MKDKKILSAYKNILDKYGIVVILILMSIFVAILKPQFVSSDNLFNVVSQASVFGVMALAETFIIISGGIDLSAGSVVAFAGVFGAAVGQLSEASGKVLPWLPEMPLIVSIIAAILAGMLCGLVNGVLIAKAKTPPFIATLGMMTIVRGFSFIFTGGKPVSHLIDGYNVIGGKLFDIIPVQVLIFLLAAALCWILYNRMRFGIETSAVGSNLKASYFSGVRVQKTLIKVYLLSGFLYGIAAIILIGRVKSVHPNAAKGYELTAIAASVIGGISPTGGQGSIVGTIIGALVLSTLQNGMTLLGVGSYWQQIAEGLIIILAVFFDMRRNLKNS